MNSFVRNLLTARLTVNSVGKSVGAQFIFIEGSKKSGWLSDFLGETVNATVCDRVAGSRFSLREETDSTLTYKPPWFHCVHKLVHVNYQSSYRAAHVSAVIHISVCGEMLQRQIYILAFIRSNHVSNTNWMIYPRFNSFQRFLSNTVELPKRWDTQ